MSENTRHPLIIIIIAVYIYVTMVRVRTVPEVFNMTLSDIPVYWSGTKYTTSSALKYDTYCSNSPVYLCEVRASYPYYH